jgi:hypothetical protein
MTLNTIDYIIYLLFELILKINHKQIVQSKQFMTTRVTQTNVYAAFFWSLIMLSLISQLIILGSFNNRKRCQLIDSKEIKDR